ncbi:hypothetical protein HID58_022373 [Brassica napus]|uniref:Di19 zinc-binding domain-containing protein n=2 Tax=Brassica TaxID=3705 RepID=A0ABQ8CZ45_BRANA|nr:hypothetical protein HID58_022373 [Brassica napus]
MVSTEPSLHMEVEGEDEFREEYACPFCSDYFDIVSLCCHIDEDHPMDTINGITSWGLRRWSSYFLEDGRILTSEYSSSLLLSCPRYTVRAFCMRHYEKISCCVIVRGDKAMQLLECGLKVKEYRSNLITKAMAAMSKNMDLAKQAKVMREFQKQSAQMDMTVSCEQQVWYLHYKTNTSSVILSASKSNHLRSSEMDDLEKRLAALR